MLNPIPQLASAPLPFLITFMPSTSTDRGAIVMLPLVKSSEIEAKPTRMNTSHHGHPAGRFLKQSMKATTIRVRINMLKPMKSALSMGVNSLSDIDIHQLSVTG